MVVFSNFPRVLNTGGALERPDALRYPQGMTTSTTQLSVYQLRIVLRGISPLIWLWVLSIGALAKEPGLR
jgi:hypothetical protein